MLEYVERDQEKPFRALVRHRAANPDWHTSLLVELRFRRRWIRMAMEEGARPDQGDMHGLTVMHVLLADMGTMEELDLFYELLPLVDAHARVGPGLPLSGLNLPEVALHMRNRSRSGLVFDAMAKLVSLGVPLGHHAVRHEFRKLLHNIDPLLYPDIST
jgi:hypothetical protein